MDDIAIRAYSLGKRYRIRETGGVTGLVDLARRRLGRPGDGPNQFWALKDISFDIRKGEVVGVLGHNGAGKSTLLKVLTRITNPTEGWARINGRVGMLLEVGTGFHPHLTGRENVIVGGAILGMSRRETLDKYDAIVEFAEMAGFMDMPVGHYSSGMALRLALSVAIHLDAEVVFLDEIWAVGDHAFQYKTWRRIEQLIASGRTFVIVAHNLQIIERLCTRCLLLDHGTLTMDGTPAEVIGRYRDELRRRSSGSGVPVNGGSTSGAGGVDIVEARLDTDDVRRGERLHCHLVLEARAAGKVTLGLSVRDGMGRTVAVCTQGEQPLPWSELTLLTGRNSLRCAIPVVFPAANTFELVLELRGEDGLAAYADLPFSVTEHEVVVADAGGRGVSVPALTVDWRVEEGVAE